LSRRRFVTGDVLLGDVLSRRRFVRRRFVCASKKDLKSTEKIGFGQFLKMADQDTGKRSKKLSLEDKARIAS
jgi:hypothetical protein